MKFLVAAVLLFSAMTALRAQDSLVQRVGIQFAYHPYDFFSGVHYTRERKRFDHRFQLSAGTRTALRQRFYPQLGYQLGFDLLDKSAFRAGPFVRATGSLLRVNKNASHGYVYNEELFVGASAAIGKNNLFRLSGGFGPAWEQSWSPLSARFASYFSWNYFGEISWSYAF